MASILFVVLGAVLFGATWALDRRHLVRAEAADDAAGVEWYEGRVAMQGTIAVGFVVAGAPLALIAAVGAPAVLVAVAAVPLVALGVRASNVLARARPELRLQVLRWPDELRTLSTPARRPGRPFCEWKQAPRVGSHSQNARRGPAVARRRVTPTGPPPRRAGGRG